MDIMDYINLVMKEIVGLNNRALQIYWDGQLMDQTMAARLGMI